jgi:hypothetical protein
MSRLVFSRASLWGVSAAAVLAATTLAAQPATAPPQALGPAPQATPLPPPNGYAQPPNGPYGPPPPGAYGAPPPGAYGLPPPGGFATNADPRLAYRDAYVANYFNYLRNTLRITETQLPAWMRFEETVRANMQERQAVMPLPRDPRAGAAPLPDLLAARRQRLEEERARLDALDAALVPLYEALSEQQRRVADVVLSPEQILNGPRSLTMRDRLRARRPFGPF